MTEQEKLRTIEIANYYPEQALVRKTIVNLTDEVERLQNHKEEYRQTAIKLAEENERLRSALERIASATASQFAKVSDIPNELKQIAAEALEEK